jgi:hypothetical protein
MLSKLPNSIIVKWQDDKTEEAGDKGRKIEYKRREEIENMKMITFFAGRIK